jgi:hypothetical protein
MRRYTRLTNAHSKNAALGVFLCYYNFCTIHTTLRITPCMAASVMSRMWEIADLVKLLDRPVAATISN